MARKTDLSFPEIAAELFLSPKHNHVAGILAVPDAGRLSRSQAVARARDLALLER